MRINLVSRSHEHIIECSPNCRGHGAGEARYGLRLACKEGASGALTWLALRLAQVGTPIVQMVDIIQVPEYA